MCNKMVKKLLSTSQGQFIAFRLIGYKFQTLLTIYFE